MECVFLGPLHYVRSLGVTDRCLLVVALAIALSACGNGNGGASEPSFVPGEVAIIPRPAAVWVDAAGSRFELDEQTLVVVDAGVADAKNAADLVVEILSHAFPGRAGPSLRDAPDATRGAIVLTSHGADPALGDEGYELVVDSTGVVVRAAGGRGLLHGVQSLRQLLPPEIESTVAVERAPEAIDWSLPGVRIVDQPRFPWRGLMLDTSRFFVPFEYVMRTIDLLALHKMSVLHLHLSDDQGWRIESERHPELQIHGALWDAELAPDEIGGYYTRAQLEEIVEHAHRLGIEIVPEIDVPGHSLAILRALPELACSATPGTVRRREEFRITPWFEGPLIHEEVLCACDERVYAFVADVLDELIAIFPGRWVHLGGDETPTTEWQTSHLCRELAVAGEIAGPDEVQAYFSQRVEELVRERGKRMIGWTETLANEQAAGDRFALSDSFVTMHWNGFFSGDPPHLYERDVVQAPIFTLYLDWYNSTSLDEVYAYDPVPDDLTPEEAEHVLGAEGAMWTGFPQQRSLERIDIHLFPKLLAIAELTWSARGRRDLSDFASRRAAHERRLDLLGVTLGICTDCLA